MKLRDDGDNEYEPVFGVAEVTRTFLKLMGWLSTSKATTRWW